MLPSRFSSTDKPMGKVHWVLPHQLAVGGLPTHQDGVLLEQAGIRSILSLNAPAEGALPEEFADKFHCQRYILPDRYYLFPLQIPQLAAAVHLIYQSIANHQPIYVHCLAGVERSPTVCIAYLCRYQKMSLWEAAYHVKRCYPPAFPSANQLQVIRDWLGLDDTKPNQ